MAFLIGNVTEDSRDVGRAYAEGRIARLPGKPFELRPPCMNPFRRIRLDDPHRFRDRRGRRQRNQQMNVVLCAPDRQSFSVQFTQNSTQIRVKVSANFSCEEWSAVLGAENNVRQQIGEGLRHSSFAPSGLDGWRCTGTQGLRPGLFSSARSGLNSTRAAIRKRQVAPE